MQGRVEPVTCGCACMALDSLLCIVYLCKYFPRSRAFSLIRVDYRVYAQASRHSRGHVASACAFLAYTGAHQVENNYKDELYMQAYPCVA